MPLPNVEVEQHIDTFMTSGDAAAAREAIGSVVVKAANVAALASLNVSNGQAVELLGYYTAGDGGGQPLYYSSGSSATVNGVTAFNGPAGVGRFLSTTPWVVRTSKAGFVGDDSTDNQSKMAAIVAYVGTLTKTRYKRADIIFDTPGKCRISGKHVIPNFVNIRVENGCTLVYSGAEYTTPFIEIGEASPINVADLDLPELDCVNQHLCSTEAPTNVDLDGFAGYCIASLQESTLRYGQTSNFATGVKLHAKGSITYVDIYPRNMWFHRCCMDFVGDTGYISEINVYGGSFLGLAPYDHEGSTYGVRMRNLGVAGNAPQTVVFFKPCFQMREGTTWAAGQAVVVGKRRNYAGLEYIATTAGTTGATPPTHTSGTASDGTVTWRYVGRYRRSAMLLQDAGAACRVINARVETGYGAPVQIEGDGGNGLVFETQSFSYTSAANPAHVSATDIEIWPTAANPAGLRSIVRPVSVPDAMPTAIPAIDYRSIIGASGLYCPGMGWMNYFDSSFTAYQVSSGARHTVYGLYRPFANPVMGVLLPLTYRFRKWKVCVDAPLSASKPYFRAWGLNLARTTQAISAVGKQLLGDSCSITDGAYMLVTSGPTELKWTVMASAAFEFLFVSWDSAHVRSVVFEPERTYINASTTAGIDIAQNPTPVPLFGAGFQGPRGSAGTPSSGHFPVLGEVIFDATGAGNGWKVTAAGVLAPAWAGTTVVLAGEYRTNASKTYYATAAGTTGSTAPTHTSGAVSDGTITWQYVGAAGAVTSL